MGYEKVPDAEDVCYVEGEAVWVVEPPPREESPRARLGLALLMVGVLLGVIYYASSGGPVRKDPPPEDEPVGSAPSSREDENATVRADIVHVILDDVGRNDLWESSDLDAARTTPHITQLARDGVVLGNYYGQSYCTPARAALLTGKWVHKIGFSGADVRGGTTEILALNNYSIPLGHRLLPEVLKEYGYETHAVGKWNVGHCNEVYVPWRRGFDTFFGYFSDGIDYVTHQVDSVASARRGQGYVEINATEFALVDLQSYESDETFSWSSGVAFAGNYTTTLFSRRATERLAAARTHAYLWLGYHGMHDNDGDFASEDDDYWTEAASRLGAARARFGKGLREIDRGVGDVVATLEARARPYVVVVHSDNGGFPCAEYCAGNNHPLKGMKFFDFDGALHVPALLYSTLLPSRTAFARYGGLMHHVDWLATFVALAGGDVDALLDADDFDSVDHSDFIRRQALSPAAPDDDTYAARSDIIFSVDETHATVRRGPFKLLRRRSDSTYYPPLHSENASYAADQCATPSNAFFLYNIDDDPYETTNLYYNASYAALLAELDAWADAAYAADYFHIPHPRSNALTADMQAAFSSSLADETTKVLVPWGCHVFYR